MGYIWVNITNQRYWCHNCAIRDVCDSVTSQVMENLLQCPNCSPKSWVLDWCAWLEFWAHALDAGQGTPGPMCMPEVLSMCAGHRHCQLALLWSGAGCSSSELHWVNGGMTWLCSQHRIGPSMYWLGLPSFYQSLSSAFSGCLMHWNWWRLWKVAPVEFLLMGQLAELADLLWGLIFYFFITQLTCCFLHYCFISRILFRTSYKCRFLRTLSLV